VFKCEQPKTFAPVTILAPHYREVPLPAGVGASFSHPDFLSLLGAFGPTWQLHQAILCFQWSPPMREPLLPIRCPKCAHAQVHLYISSATVLTIKCPECAFAWSVEVATLPPDTKAQLAEAILH
jgi:phage FluMu protein Com